MAERFKAAVLKTAVRVSVPWVRIPPHPPVFHCQSNRHLVERRKVPRIQRGCSRVVPAREMNVIPRAGLGMAVCLTPAKPHGARVGGLRPCFQTDSRPRPNGTWLSSLRLSSTGSRPEVSVLAGARTSRCGHRHRISTPSVPRRLMTDGTIAGSLPEWQRSPGAIGRMTGSSRTISRCCGMTYRVAPTTRLSTVETSRRSYRGVRICLSHSRTTISVPFWRALSIAR